ncbi:MAG: hypothetical protein ACYC4R_05425 [Anaerolineae bacterium]
MGALRNAIVHESHYPDEIIADPRPEIINELRRLIDTLNSPTTIYPRFRRDVRVFGPQDHLGDVLAHMQEKDYSQVVVRIDAEHRVLSSEGIVRWLSRARDVGLADLEGAVVEEVYECEDPRSLQCMGPEESVDAAILAFEGALTEGIPRLQAILITDRGRSTEQPLGIITPWDIINLAGANDVA